MFAMVSDFSYTIYYGSQLHVWRNYLPGFGSRGSQAPPRSALGKTFSPVHGCQSDGLRNTMIWDMQMRLYFALVCKIYLFNAHSFIGQAILMYAKQFSIACFWFSVYQLVLSDSRRKVP